MRSKHGTIYGRHPRISDGESLRVLPSNGPDMSRRKKPSRAEIRIRRAAAGLLAVGLAAGLVHVAEVVSHDQNNPYNLPDATHQEGRQAIDAKVAAGKLIRLRIEGDYSSASSLARGVVGPKHEYRDLSRAILHELGDVNPTDIPYGTEVAVPATPEALAIAQSQIAESQLTSTTSRQG